MSDRKKANDDRVDKKFPGDTFEIEIVNTKTIVHNMKELVDVAVDIL